MRRNQVVSLVYILLIISGCTQESNMTDYVAENVNNLPKTLEPLPVKPDYSLDENWAILPDRETVITGPKGYKFEMKTDLGFDVFYIHPTMYNNGDSWVASLQNKEVNSFVDNWPMVHQASVFKGAGRVFAPRYRQAHYRAFMINIALSEEALKLAYSDVREAFMFWLENWDEGRPIIIAGHSQGSFHARWLLQEFFDGTELSDRLVVAYMPGFDIYESDFKDIAPCKSSDDTHCFCSWMTYATGYTPDWIWELKKVPVCINPISWETNSSPNDLELHMGILTDKFKFKYEHSLTARVHKGMLWLDEPHILGGSRLHRNNWHVGDYNLFWANIRSNIKDRIMSFNIEQGNL